MRNLENYADICLMELRDIGIETGNVVEWKVNTRAKSIWGRCKHINGNHIIEISSRLLDERASEKGLKTTIIHELLHTIPGCNNHKDKWVKMATVVNEKLGYNIKRTTSDAEKGVSDNGYKFSIICPRCSSVKKYRINCESIQDPNKIICKKCGGKATKVRIGA